MQLSITSIFSILIFSLLLNIWQAFRPDIDITSKSSIADGRAAKAVVDFAPKVLGSELYEEFVKAMANAGTDNENENKN